MTWNYECGTCGSRSLHIWSTWSPEHKQYEWRIECFNHHVYQPTGTQVIDIRNTGTPHLTP